MSGRFWRLAGIIICKLHVVFDEAVLFESTYIFVCKVAIA
jgi:hypothetical protein